jgi:hypothetical protein
MLDLCPSKHQFSITFQFYSIAIDEFTMYLICPLVSGKRIFADDRFFILTTYVLGFGVVYQLADSM